MAALHLSTTAGHIQSQTLSPRLQRAVQLLQMSSQDFAALVRGKLENNPFLEAEEDIAPMPSAVGSSSDLHTDTTDVPIALPEMLAPEEFREPEVLASGLDDRDLWLADRPFTTRASGEDTATAMDLAVGETTLATHLLGQLHLLPLSGRDLCIAGAIAESLDDDGYLRIPLDELVPAMELDPEPEAEELVIGLRLVQSLEPAGVGARSVAECLRLQCPHIEDPGLRALAHQMVGKHLDALAERDVGRLAQLLNQPPARIEAAIDAIRHLSPRPGWGYGSTRVDYIVPDVIVRRGQNSWHVHLNPAVVPRVRLNKVYEELFQRHRSAQHTEMAEHLQDARWTLRNVEQRFSTILDVAQAIIRKQRLFLEYGAMAMKPLVLREIADEVGVHESTVSRVTNNKYMSTPQGVFELKYFFSRPMLSASGKACSATAIRELIGDLIAAESSTRPLSDGEITRQLAAQGLCVARRTVTKYRQMLRLEPADKRRRVP